MLAGRLEQKPVIDLAKRRKPMRPGGRPLIVVILIASWLRDQFMAASHEFL